MDYQWFSEDGPHVFSTSLHWPPVLSRIVVLFVQTARPHDMALVSAMMALHVLEPALQVVFPLAAVALSFAGNSDAVGAEGGSIPFFKLLHVALGGFLTLGYFEGQLQCKVRFREQVLLRRFAP